MKRMICLFLVMLMGVVAFADEYVISKIKCLDTEFYYSREITFKYDDEDDVYYFYRSGYSLSYWFTLTPDEVEKLRNVLIKVKEWGKIAKENKATISKEIPDSVIEVEGTMKSGNSWYVTRREIPLHFFFISSFSDDAELTSLTIVGGEVESKQNQFVGIEFEDVLFINTSIDDFIKAISKETVEEAKRKHANQKNASGLFN